MSEVFPEEVVSAEEVPAEEVTDEVNLLDPEVIEGNSVETDDAHPANDDELVVEETPNDVPE